MKSATIRLTIVAALGLLALPAHAYLDPASGSMFLQLILGGLAGLAVVIKLYWQRLRGWFGKRSEHDHSDD